MQSLKLCVTVKRHLEKKYNPTALKQIEGAVKHWAAADAQRGIRTLYLAVDDTAAMKAQAVAPVSGTATAARIKTAVDALWRRLTPDYLVLFGGEEIIPRFVVTNPSYDPNGDEDKHVPTDNPYACSAPFMASRRSSYLVPDRVIGRICDMMADPDPAWLTDYLAAALACTSRPASFYSGVYAICCDEWKRAGEDCLQQIGAPAASLLIAPPANDASATARARLSSRLHLIKCHGAQLDPKFYGQQGENYPVSLASHTLRTRLKPGTLQAAMCCYGAQVYSPADPAAQDPGQWPIASTYLRKGALGFCGSTMIAWVGGESMMCADWIASSYLKEVLAGASLGQAFLEAKQDYVRWINQQGRAPDIADEKTLIEYVLLGDPSLHPVSAATPAAKAGVVSAAIRHPAFALVAQERRQRRVVRAQMADNIRSLLPERSSAKGAALARARKVLHAAQSQLGAAFRRSVGRFRLRPATPRVEKLSTPLPLPAGLPTSGHRRSPTIQSRESLEYYWSARRQVDGHSQIRMVKAETDAKGHLLRSTVLRSS